MIGIDIPNMHDWTLIDASFDWEAAQVVMRFRTAAGLKQLIASKTAELRIPQRLEWGRSASVNDAQLIADEHCPALRIEMQSGDAIILEAASLEFR